MLVIYDSRMGLGKAFAEQLGYPTKAISEEINEECVLVTRNEGQGQISKITKEFLDKNANLVKGVVVNGSMERHANTFCFAADKIKDQYHLNILRKINGQGNEADVIAVKEAIAKL